MSYPSLAKATRFARLWSSRAICCSQVKRLTKKKKSIVQFICIMYNLPVCCGCDQVTWREIYVANEPVNFAHVLFCGCAPPVRNNNLNFVCILKRDVAHATLLLVNNTVTCILIASQLLGAIIPQVPEHALYWTLQRYVLCDVRYF